MKVVNSRCLLAKSAWLMIQSHFLIFFACEIRMWFFLVKSCSIPHWLVVPTPLKNMKVSLDDKIPNFCGKIKVMFQTTNQMCSIPHVCWSLSPMFQSQAREDISNSPAFNGKASARAKRETMQPSSAMATSVSTCVLLESFRNLELV